MYKFCFTENLSLAFNLGVPGFSEADNISLYGYRPGQQVRGHNLKVHVTWENVTSVQSCRDATKRLLKAWDHSFLNQRAEFAGRPVTLENICLAAFRLFKGEAGFSEVQVEQGDWSATAKRAEAPDSLDLIDLDHRVRFQSLLKTNQRYLPLDFVLTLTWTGAVDHKNGLVAPWEDLKRVLPLVQQELAQTEEFVSTNQEVSKFLAYVAEKFFVNSKPSIQRLQFFDPKDKVTYSFNASFKAP